VSSTAPQTDRPTAIGHTDPTRPAARPGSLDAVAATARTASSWARSDEARRAWRELAADVAEGGWRVVRSIRLPTVQGLLDFLSHQVLANVVGWLAGLAAAHIVTQLFAVRGFRNLWGLAGSGGRTLVSNDDYRVITTVTGFTVGLLMMLFVRHFLLRWIAETRVLRAARRGGAGVGLAACDVAVDPPDMRFDDGGGD